MTRALASTIKTANRAILIEGDFDAIPAYFAPGYVAHATHHEVIGGHAAIRKFLGLYRRAFVDIAAEVEILVSGRDRIAWQRIVRARHLRSFKGFRATGRRIVWRDMVVSRFRKGRIVEDWVITDLAEQLLRARKP